MTKATDMALAELMTTKYCHDLAGPIGAVNNGVEFLKDGDENMKEQSIELLETSAKEAVERLLFFRQAFGATNKNMDVEMSHISEVCDHFFAQRKVNVHWEIDDLFHTLTGEMRHQLVKLLLNLMMAGSHLVVYGAEMKVSISGSKKLKISVTLEHEKLKDDPSVEGILCDLEHLPEMDSRNVQLYFTQKLITEMGMQAKVSKSSGVFKVEVAH